MKHSPFVKWLKLSVLPPVAAALMRGVARSMRYETRGHEVVDALYREGRHAILAFWHGQQLMMLFGYRGTGTHALISQHGDGEIIARIVARFGHQAVRGSSTRGGAGALRALIKLGRSGQDVAVTPDGPKGPRQVAKLGVIQLAKGRGPPIVPMVLPCSKKKLFASWDRYMVPYPFSRGLFLYGKPLWVPREAEEAMLESLRVELETALNQLTDQAEQDVERER